MEKREMSVKNKSENGHFVVTILARAVIYGLAVASGMTRKQDGGSNQCNQSSATTAD